MAPNANRDASPATPTASTVFTWCTACFSADVLRGNPGVCAGCRLPFNRRTPRLFEELEAALAPTTRTSPAGKAAARKHAQHASTRAAYLAPVAGLPLRRQGSILASRNLVPIIGGKM